MTGGKWHSNYPHNHVDSDDDDNIIDVIDLDEDDKLPDAEEFDDEDQSRAQASGQIDDSVHCFSRHEQPIFAVACSPISNSRLVATGGEDGVVYLWQVGDGEGHHKLQGHADSVTSVEFSKDGKLLASGGMDGVVNIWESSSGKLKQKLEGPSGTIEWLQWHPQKHMLLAGSDDSTSWQWNVDTGLCMQVLIGHLGTVTCGRFTPDGEFICAGSTHGSLRIWRQSNKSAVSSSVCAIEAGQGFHSEVLNCVSISDDSRLAITGSADNTARLVNIRSGIPVAALTRHVDSIQSATFLSGATASMAATCALDGQVIVWDVQTARVRNVCEQEHEVLQLQWCPASQLICAGCADGTVRLWDHRTGRSARELQGHAAEIQALALSSDGSIIVSGSDDCTARAFEVNSI